MDKRDANLGAAVSAAFAASTADSVSTTAATLPITANSYRATGELWACTVKRTFLYFDTSALPTGATLVSATLSVYVSDIYEDTIFPYYDVGDLVVSNGQPTYPHDPLVVGDYGDTNYSDEATVAFEDITEDAYLDIDLPVSAVTAGGTTKLRLDQIGHDGGGGQTMGYAIDSASGTNKPTLTVAYSLPGDPPPLPQVDVGGTMRDAANALLRVGNQWRLVTKVMVNATGSGMTGAA